MIPVVRLHVVLGLLAGALAVTAIWLAFDNPDIDGTSRGDDYTCLAPWDTVLNDALFTVDYNEMVIVKDIDFYSLCEHHLLPFFGKCHVAYIPKTRVIGLSKIPRVVDVFARRLQIQERMTNQIAETISEKIDPLGVAVVCEGTHLCMSMRGVEKQNSFAVTSAMLGAFHDNARTRMEFLELIRGRSSHSVSDTPGLACVGD